MLRIVSKAVRDIVTRTNVTNLKNCLAAKQPPVIEGIQQRFFGALSSTINNFGNVGNFKERRILGQTEVSSAVPVTLLPTVTPVRTLIKYSRKKGKRKSVKAVLHRFYRLNWGIWIRTIAGRHKRLWKKSVKQKRRYKQHIFCNATQSHLLDKMVTSYWKRPHYYVDDPYNPYHKREEFPITRKTPQPY